MLGFFGGLRELNTVSVLFRLSIAAVFGGAIGLEREKKRRAAGFRTYMLVCIGAALTMMLGQFEAYMLAERWAGLTSAATDVSRVGAQVINGIGFLGAGTVIVTKDNEVKGLTTAAGLWASACMGLAVGAGFYECVFLGLLLIIVCVRLLPYLENYLIEAARNMNILLECASLEALGSIIRCIKGLDIQIYDMEIEHIGDNAAKNPRILFTLRLRRKRSHAQILAEISKLDCIRMIEEV